MGHPPALFGLMSLDYNSMTWNANDVPILNLVRQTIDSASRTLAIWQRQQAKLQRAKLSEHQCHLDIDDEEQDDLETEHEERGGHVELEEGSAAEDITEVESEAEEEL